MQNHLAWCSERTSDIGVLIIFIVYRYVWCVFLLLGAIGSLSFVVALRGHLFKYVYSYVRALQGSRRKGLYEYCDQLISGLLYCIVSSKQAGCELSLIHTSYSYDFS